MHTSRMSPLSHKKYVLEHDKKCFGRGGHGKSWQSLGGGHVKIGQCLRGGHAKSWHHFKELGGGGHNFVRPAAEYFNLYFVSQYYFIFIKISFQHVPQCIQWKLNAFSVCRHFLQFSLNFFCLWPELIIFFACIQITACCHCL